MSSDIARCAVCQSDQGVRAENRRLYCKTCGSEYKDRPYGLTMGERGKAIFYSPKAETEMNEPLRRCECGNLINRAGSCPKCGRLQYEVDPVIKVRRRIEDYLRKADSKIVMRVANELNIKTT